MKGKMTLFVLAILVLTLGLAVPFVSAQAGDDDLYSISPGSIEDPDIVWSRSIAVVKEKLYISARVRGRGEHPVEVQFILEAPDLPKVTLPAKLIPQEEGEKEYRDYQASWQPEKAEIYKLTVQVDPKKKSRDRVRKNNTATVILPVVWRELHIIPWGTTKKMKWLTAISRELWKNPDVFQSTVGPARAEVAYWNRRGMKVLGYMYTKESSWMKAEGEEAIEELVSFIVNRAGQYSAVGCEGLIIDELGSYWTPEGLEFMRRFGLVYDRVRQEYPDLQVYTWIAGGLHPNELANGARNEHIMLGECYEAIHARSAPVWRRRLEVYISKLNSKKDLIAVGISGDCGRGFAPQVERSVQMIREIGPEMRGIQYYSVPDRLFESIDRMTFNYFIKPVVSVWEKDIVISDPSSKSTKERSLQVSVRNIGGIPAKNVGVNIYARHLKSNERDLVEKVVIPRIGNGNEDRALIQTTWTPKRSGPSRLEVEIEPSDQYTILSGLTEKAVLPVGEPPSRSLTKEGLTVTEDDIWLSNYTPKKNEKVSLQLRVHNVTKAPIKKARVKIYARHLDTDERTLLTSTEIPEIRTGSEVLKEKEAESVDHKIIEGTKYATARWGDNTKVHFSQALVDATWTPKRSGYYQIEVELPSSSIQKASEEFARRPVPVGK